MHQIEQPPIDSDFPGMWMAGQRHLASIGLRADSRDSSSQTPADIPSFRWIRKECHAPFRDHHSFFFGVESYFVVLQDADRPANRLINPEATIAIARAWDGHPCVLRMRRSETGWAPCEEGWALRRLPLRPDGRLDAEAFDRGTHGPVIDPNLVPPRTDVLMTDEEFHDFAIQVAASQIKEDGGDSIRSQNDPAVLPSINWIDSDGKAQWALVQATRYGALEPGLPVRWPEFKRNINAAFAADSGLRAVVGAVPVLGLEAPLHRGQPMHVRWLGFEEV